MAKVPMPFRSKTDSLTSRSLQMFQHIQFKLAEMATALVTSRLIVRQAATALDSKSPEASTLCSMAKLSATDQCFQVCLNTMKISQGHIYIPENKKMLVKQSPPKKKNNNKENCAIII